MEHQRCYIYSPPEVEERPSKRQRVSKAGVQAQTPERLQLFRELWSEQEQQLQKTLEEADKATQDRIVDFVSTTPKSDANQPFAIPTGLVVAGPSIASHAPFFGRLGHRLRDDTDSAYVVLTSGECPNLKTLLKNLIKKTTSRLEQDDDDDVGQPSTSVRNGPKVLDFDLAHLRDWHNRNRVQSIVVVILDSEALDANILVELVDLLYSWLDRLPFVLLFGIATSAESFEDRLSGKSLRYLEGQKFDVTQSDEIIEKMFRVTVASSGTPLRIGPNLCRRMLDRQKDHVQNVQDFSDGLKYGYMSHFYASCPSILLKPNLSLSDLTLDTFEATRNLPSFRRHVEESLDKGHTDDVGNLLESDQHLYEYIMEHVQQGQQALSALSESVKVLAQIRHSLQMSPQVPVSAIWIRASSGELLGSPLLRETMLSIKKISSDRFTQLLYQLDASYEEHPTIDVRAYRRGLQDLIKNNTSSTPLRSQYDVRNESLRTTVVAQKVLLSKHKATLSEQDKTYSELVGEFHDHLERYFSETFVDPRDLKLIEVLMYDLKSPHTEVFQPKPRFAIERALASPHDYLGCECCGPDGEKEEGASLAATQPATAILYQLYLESGSLINVSDLWSAFNTLGGNDEESESQTMALFQRALAELKYLGLVKPTRKKADHITKMMWRGL